MIKVFRLGVAAAALTALVPLTAGGASASQPDNDVPAGAVHLTLGKTIAENTTQATTGPFDRKVAYRCKGPVTRASVWFRYTAPDDNGFMVDASHSDYKVGLMAFRGIPSVHSIRGCGGTTLGVRTQAGRTYTIMAFSSTRQQGGHLRLSIQKAPPAPTITMSVDPEGQADADGNAHLSGSFTCTDAAYLYTDGELTQVWRRLKITGYVFVQSRGMCDGQPHPWSAIVTSDNGLYGAGDATVELYSFACGVLTCVDDEMSADVSLTGPAQPSGGAVTPAQRPITHPGCGAGEAKTMWQQSRACAAGRLGAR